MHVNYIFIFTEKMKCNVKVNKTYKKNVVIAGILDMVIWISKKVVMVQNSPKMLGAGKNILLRGVKVTKILCMAQNGSLNYNLT